MEIFPTIAKISLFCCWGILIWATLYNDAVSINRTIILIIDNFGTDNRLIVAALPIVIITSVLT